MSPIDSSPNALPLTPGQRAIWLHHRMLGESSAYHICRYYRIEGVPDLEALAEALHTLFKRHEALRLRFPLLDDEPAQCVGAIPQEPLRVIRWEDGLSDQEQLRRIEEAAFQSFDLEQGGLFRAFLFHDGSRSVFLTAMHHLIVDGRCIKILMGELGEIYSALTEGRGPELDTIELPYPEWVIRETGRLQRLPEAHVQFWRDQLASPPPARGIAAVASNESTTAAIVERQIPAKLWSTFEPLAASTGATRFMACLAAYAALEYRLTGQDDLVLGVPAVRRGEADAARTVGLLLDLLPLRVRLCGETTFRELVTRAQQDLRQVLQHASVPLSRALEEAGVQTSGRATLPFSTLVNRIREDHALRLGDLPVSNRVWIEQDTRFPLTLYVMGNDADLRLRASYQRNLFPAGLIEHLLEQLLTLLSQAIEHPDAPLSAPSLRVSPAAGAGPLRGAVDSQPQAQRPDRDGEESAAFETVLDRVRDRALHAPTRPAVSGPEGIWSYTEVWQRTLNVAGALEAAGVHPGDRVAVYLERSNYLVPALLGTMAAGAAFVVLNPAYPPARTARQVELAAPRAWLTAETTPAPGGKLADAMGELPRVCVSSLENGGASHAGGARPRSEDLAYVAFTSGTTGDPLGVLGEHGPLSHFLNWHVTQWEFEPESRFSVLSGIGHDPLLRDLFTPLWIGGLVCVPPATVMTEAQALAEWLARNEISAAHLTPALSRLLVQGVSSSGTGLSAVRHLFLAGEALTWKDLAQLRQAAPHARIINYYGATETPQGIAYYEAGERLPTRSVPVGRGIDGVRLEVRDPQGRPTGVWEPGEIWVRTTYLCREYLNDPDRTSARFATSSDDPEVREFRTGDRGRYLPDGSVEVLDRIDHQINILGYRIEPGDIQAALLAHPRIQECVVEAQERAHGDQQLVAYLRADGPLTRAELHRHLRGLLPAHMIPGHFEILHHLPLTPNGKVDHGALPLSRSEPLPKADDLPATSAERDLARLWCELLGLERLGVNDDFFTLGGHSLHAVILLDRIHRELGARLPLSVFLHAPTVRAMATLLRPEVAGAATQAQCLVPLKSGGSLPPLFLVHGIGGGVLNYRQLAEHLGPDQPCYALQAPALAGLPHQYESIEEMAARYLRDVRETQPCGPYYLGGQSFGGRVAYEMAQQLRAAGEEVRIVALLDTRGAGYPRFRPLLSRLLCHLQVFAVSNQAARREYLRVRALAVREKVVRPLRFQLHRKLRQRQDQLPEVLQDIGLFHSEAVQNYRLIPYSGPVVLFRAKEQPVGSYPDPFCGWRELALGAFEVLEVPGDHVSLMMPPFVTVLAKQLESALARAREGRIGSECAAPVPAGVEATPRLPQTTPEPVTCGTRPSAPTPPRTGR